MTPKSVVTVITSLKKLFFFAPAFMPRVKCEVNRALALNYTFRLMAEAPFTWRLSQPRLSNRGKKINPKTPVAMFKIDGVVNRSVLSKWLLSILPALTVWSCGTTNEEYTSTETATDSFFKEVSIPANIADTSASYALAATDWE